MLPLATAALLFDFFFLFLFFFFFFLVRVIVIIMPLMFLHNCRCYFAACREVLCCCSFLAHLICIGQDFLL